MIDNHIPDWLYDFVSVNGYDEFYLNYIFDTPEGQESHDVGWSLLCDIRDALYANGLMLFREQVEHDRVSGYIVWSD